MTDIDDVLTLPVDDDDEFAARPVPDVGAPQRVESVSSTELIALSSSEARLATALLMQAQVLEGMRREQADLLKRIEAGPSRAALVRSLGQVEAALKQMARLQQKARGKIARTRRRSTRLTAASLLLTIGLAGVVGWMAWILQRELPDSLSSMTLRLDAAEVSRGEDIDRAVAAATVGQSEALAAITARLDGEQQRLLGELSVLEGENEATRAALGEAQTVNAGLRHELGSMQASHAELDEQLTEVRRERIQQMGENARLVGQAMDGERRLAELSDTVAGLQAAQAALAKSNTSAIISSPAVAVDGLAGRISRALQSSGAPDLVVLEVGAVSDGVLEDLLLRRTDPSGVSASVLRAGRGWIVIERGRARLRLDPVRELDADQDSVLEIDLPALDAVAWRALGVTVPGVFTPLPQVMAALDVMLAGQGWRIVGLTSFDGDTLGGVELVAEDENGIVQRHLKAATGFMLPTGPELELRDGTIRIGQDERPFFRGVFRLPLPGTDYGTWLTSTTGSTW